MIQLVQNKLSTTNTSGSITGSFTTKPVLGNFIIVAFTYFGSGGDNFTSLADNQVGNTYTQVGTTQHATASNNFVRLYYAKNIKSSDTFTITGTFGGTPGAGDLMMGIYEYSQVDRASPLDQTIQATGTNTAVDPGSITPTQPSSLFFAVGTDDNGNNATPSAQTSPAFTLEDNQADSATHQRFYTQDYRQQTIAAVNAKFTIGLSSNFAVIAAVFVERANLPENKYRYGTVGDGISRSEAWT